MLGQDIRCVLSPLQGQGVSASKVTLKKLITQQKEHYFAPLTHSPKGRRRASNTMCVVTPSGTGGERERCESFKKMTTYFVF